ncbi:hypothetical protein AGIG_G16465 [Arapaima gigas]
MSTTIPVGFFSRTAISSGKFNYRFYGNMRGRSQHEEREPKARLCEVAPGQQVAVKSSHPGHSCGAALTHLTSPVFTAPLPAVRFIFTLDVDQ